MKHMHVLKRAWSLSTACCSGTLKGFGFATFLTRGQAESAIRTTNGKVCAVLPLMLVTCVPGTPTALQDGSAVATSVSKALMAHSLTCVSSFSLCLRASSALPSQALDGLSEAVKNAMWGFACRQ